MSGFLVSAGVYVQSVDDPPSQLLRPRPNPHKRLIPAAPEPPMEFELPQPWHLAWDTQPQFTPRLRRGVPPHPLESVDVALAQTDLDQIASGNFRAFICDYRSPLQRRIVHQSDSYFVNQTDDPGNVDIPTSVAGWLDLVPAGTWQTFLRSKRRQRADATEANDHAPEYLYLPAAFDAPKCSPHQRSAPTSVLDPVPQQDTFIMPGWHGTFRPPLHGPKPGHAHVDYPAQEFEQAPQQLWFYSQTFGEPQWSRKTVARRKGGANSADPGSFEQDLAANHELGWFAQQTPPWMRRPKRALALTLVGAGGYSHPAWIACVSIAVAGPYVVVAGEVNWYGAVMGEVNSQ